MTTCTGCGEAKDAQAFGWRDRSAGRRKRRCRDCEAAYQRGWYARNRPRLLERRRDVAEAWQRVNDQQIRDAKAVPCNDCGSRFPTEVMDFDHVRGRKRFDIGSSRRNREPVQVAAEIAKCEVVCAVCHRVRTQAGRT